MSAPPGWRPWPQPLGPNCSIWGSAPARNTLFEAQLRLGGVEALSLITRQIGELRGTLDQLAESLPDIHAQMAFPVGCYDAFRAFYDVPSPPPATRPLSFAVLLLADREPLETIYAQLAAVGAQSCANWTLYVVGSDLARRQIVERAAASDPRIRWAGRAGAESAAEAERRVALSCAADWIVLLSARALLHRSALAWFAAVAGLGAAVAYVTDEETGTRERHLVRRSSPEFRQAVDYDTLLEMNVYGETIAVETAAYRRVAHNLVTTSVSASRSSLLLSLARERRVGHLPCMLVCRDGEVPADPTKSPAAHEDAVRAHLAHAGLAERVEIAPRSGPLSRLPIRWRPRDPNSAIGLVVPTRDNGSDVARLVESLRATAAVPEALRIVVVDNGSREAETRRILAELETRLSGARAGVGRALQLVAPQQSCSRDRRGPAAGLCQ